jgi:hypothetical protein
MSLLVFHRPADFAQVAHELLQRLVFELADALAGEAEVLADFAQGHGLVGVEAEPHANDGGLAVVQVVDVLEDAVEVVGLDELVFGALDAVVGQESSRCAASGC